MTNEKDVVANVKCDLKRVLMGIDVLVYMNDVEIANGIGEDEHARRQDYLLGVSNTIDGIIKTLA